VRGCRRNRPAVSQDFARRTVLSFASEIRRADSAKLPKFWARTFAVIAWQFNPVLPVRMAHGVGRLPSSRRLRRRGFTTFPGPASSCPAPPNTTTRTTATANTLTKGLCPLAPARGFPSLPHCAALRLCRPRGFPLSLRSVTSPGRFPSPCSCYPRWRGPGPRRSCLQLHCPNSKATTKEKDQ